MSTTKYAAKWLGRLAESLAKHPSYSTYSLATVEDAVPRVRTVVHRDFLSPETPAPLLLTTTDIRSPKSAQIADNFHVEVAWYIEATLEQFRIFGNALLVAHEKHATRSSSELPRGYDWPELRKQTFNNVSGYIRASFCRPIPGSKLEEPAVSWPEKLPALGEAGTDIEREQVQRAFENFALLVICPLTVDHVELQPKPNLRTKYVIEEGEWKETALVP